MKYKYTHLFLHPSPLFNYEAEMQIRRSCYNVDRHLFVYRNMESAHSDAKERDNVIIDSNLDDIHTCFFYLKESDFIVIHNLIYSYKQLKSIPNEYCNRIIWFVWGGDLYRLPSRQDTFYLALRAVYRSISFKDYGKRIARKKINLFKLINANFIGDRLYLRTLFNNVPLSDAPYPMGLLNKDLDEWANTSFLPLFSGKTILIGHSGFPFLNHKKYINFFSKFKQKIRVILPLNYGDKEYSDYIESYSKDVLGDSAIVIRKPLTHSQYAALLNQVDIAIFDFKQQAALGNIYMLLYYKKKIYLNPKGVLFKGFKSIDIKVYSTRDLFNSSYNDIFYTSDDFSINHDYSSNFFSEQSINKKWNSIFV